MAFRPPSSFWKHWVKCCLRHMRWEHWVEFRLRHMRWEHWVACCLRHMRWEHWVAFRLQCPPESHRISHRLRRLLGLGGWLDKLHRDVVPGEQRLCGLRWQRGCGCVPHTDANSVRIPRHRHRCCLSRRRWQRSGWQDTTAVSVGRQHDQRAPSTVSHAQARRVQFA